MTNIILTVIEMYVRAIIVILGIMSLVFFIPALILETLSGE